MESAAEFESALMIIQFAHQRKPVRNKSQSGLRFYIYILSFVWLCVKLLRIMNRIFV